MNPNNPNTVPAISAAYVPYSYQAGLFQIYNVPFKRGRLNSSPTAPVVYQGITPARGTPSFDRTQTVEQIIASGYLAAPRGDPVSAILGDKQQVAWLGLDDLIGQVRKRYEIYERQLYEIELGKCGAMNALYTAEALHGPADSQQFDTRHKRIEELYAQARDERTSLWKDVSRLRLLLPEIAQSYLGARRRIEALDGSTGDLL